MDRHRRLAGFKRSNDFLKPVIRGGRWYHLVLLEQVDYPLIGSDGFWLNKTSGFSSAP